MFFSADPKPIVKKENQDKGKTQDKDKDKGGMGTSPVTSRSLPATPGAAEQACLLPSGVPVKFRPIQPEDQRLVRVMFAGVSKASIYYRYFGYVPPITSEFLARFTIVHPEREITLVAETKVEGTRQLVGVVQMVKDADPTKAELGILIADAWQQQGLGSALLDFARQVALQQGISVLYAHFMAMNRGIASLLQKQGFQVQRDHFDDYYAEVHLTTG